MVKSGEIIAAMLLTSHNLTFYQDLMAALREAIANGTIDAFAATSLSKMKARVAVEQHQFVQ